MGLVFVFQFVGLRCDLREGHGEGVGAVDVAVVLWKLEGLRDGLCEVIGDYTIPIGEDFV